MVSIVISIYLYIYLYIIYLIRCEMFISIDVRNQNYVYNSKSILLVSK